jgi:hypothetical protein
VAGAAVSEERLGRIETKLDSLAEAVVSLARMEERMVTLFKRMDKYDEAQAKIMDRLSDIEKKLFGGGLIGGYAEKVILLLIGGIITWFLKGSGQ